MAETFNPYHRWLGIPPAEQPPNHYRLLGLVLFESDPDVIESAADRQMAHVRTFQAGRYSDQSQAILNELAAAKTCLLKPQRKAEYDQELRAKFETARPSPTPVPVEAVPIIPAANTIPLAPQPNLAPQLPERLMPQIMPASRSATAAAARISRKSKRSNTTLVVGVGVACLLIVGVVAWQLNRQSPQELAAKPDSISNSKSGTHLLSSKSPNVSTAPNPPAKKSVVTPAEVKPAPAQSSMPQPVTMPPAVTPFVTPPTKVASLPAKQPAVQAPPVTTVTASLTPSPGAIVPREIKLKTSGSSPVFTPDSTLLLYGSGNGVDIYNLAEEKMIGSIGSAYQHFAVSPDGKKVAVIMGQTGKDKDSTVGIFDIATQKRLHHFSRPTEPLKDQPFFRVCGFDSTSNKLFTRTDVDLQVWDVNSGELLRHIKHETPPNGNYLGATYSLNGRQIFVNYPALYYCLDTETEVLNLVRVDLHDLDPILGKKAKAGSFGSWNFSADGQSLYARETVNEVLLEWPIPAAKLKSGVVIPDLGGAKVSPDGTRILVESKSAKGTLRVIDRPSLQTIATLQTENKLSYSEISPDNRWVILSSRSGTSLYDFGPQTGANKSSPANVAPAPPPPKVASVPATQPDVQTPPVTTAPATLTPSPGAIVPREIELRKTGAFTPWFTTDNKLLIYAGRDQIDVWNLAQEKRTGSIPAAMSQFAVSADDKKLAAAMQPTSPQSKTLIIKIFDLATLAELRQLSLPANESAGLSRFSVCGFDGTSNKLFTRTNVDLQVWDVNSGESLRHIKTENPPRNNRSISSLDGRYLTIEAPFTHVLDTQKETLIRINVGSPDLERVLGNRFASSALGSWSFSADEQTLYGTEMLSGALLQWSLPEVKFDSGVVLKDLAQIKVSPDRTRILGESKNARNTTHLLDRASFEVLATMHTPGDRIVFKAISPDNRWVLLSSSGESSLYDFGPQAGTKKSPPTQTSVPQLQGATPAPATTAPAASGPKVASLPAKTPNPQSPAANPGLVVLTPPSNPVVPREIKIPTSGGVAPIFTPDCSLLLYANTNRVDVWNLVEEKQVGSIASAFQQFAVSPDGKKLAVEEVSPGGKGLAEFIKIYELPTLKQLHELPRPPDEPSKIPFFRVCGFDSTSNKLFTRNDVDLQVWDVQTGELLQHIKHEKPPMGNPTAYSLNGRYINIPFFFGAHVLNTETQRLTKVDVTMQALQTALERLPSTTSLGSWSFTTDGEKMYGTEQVNGVLLQWSLPETRLSVMMAIKDLLFAKISPDNTRLLVELKTDREKLYVVDRVSLEVITTLPTSQGNLSSYAISPDNRWVILRGLKDASLFDFGP